MESVDGDVRLSVKLDTKTIQSSADELRKAFKNALSSLSSSDTASKALEQLNTTVESVTSSLETLQSSGNIIVQTNAQQVSEETEQVSSAIEEAKSSAETAHQALSEMENISVNTEPIEQATESIETLDEWARQTDEEIDKLFDDIAQQQAAEQNISQQISNTNADGFQANFVADEFNNLLSQINNVEELQELIMDLRTVQGQLNSESEDYDQKWESINDAVQSVLGKIREVRAENARTATSFGETTQNANETQTSTENIAQSTSSVRVKIQEFLSALSRGMQDLEGYTWNVINAFRNVGDVIRHSTGSAVPAISSASERITQFNKNILNSVKSLIKHGTASKSAKNGINSFNSVMKKGVNILLKYGLGIRSTYILFNKLKTAIKDGYKNLGGYSDEVNKSISSTMSALAKLKNQLAATFQPIVSVVVPILNKLIEKLNEAAVAVSQFFAAWTGQAYVYKAKDVQEKYVEDLEDTAEAAKEAEDALESYLSPLDDINRYEDKTTSKSTDKDDKNKGTDYSNMFETIEVENKFKTLIDEIKSYFEEMFKPIENSWNKYGATVIEKVKNTFHSLLDTINSIRSSFETVWKNGTGEEIIDNILQIFININDTIINISDNFREAWEDNEVGLSIAQTLADTFNDILEHIKNITEATAEWAKDVNFKPMLSSLDKLLKSLRGIIDLAGTWFESVWKKVFLPLAGWAIEEGAPAALEAISGALDLITAVGEQAGEILDALWEGFFAQAASWVGDAIVAFLEGLGQFLSDVANSEAAVTALLSIGAALLTIVGTIKVLSAVPAIIAAITNPITWIVAAIVAVIVVIIEILTYKDTLKEFMGDIANYWSDKLTEFLDWVKDWWDTIVTYWSDKLLKLIEWLKDFKDKWKSGWEDIKTIFKNIWDSFVDLVKKPINLIIDLINGMIGKLQDGVNGVISFLNNFGFDIPDWLGGGHVGFSLSYANFPRIPHLAQGAVIPPNREFLAVLGDQSSGNNIEAPESLIRRIVREETANNRSGNNIYNVNAKVRQKTLFDVIIDEAKVRQGQTGRNPFELT